MLLYKSIHIHKTIYDVLTVSGCIRIAMSSSLSVGVRPGTTGVGGSTVDTSMALANARASSISTSSLHKQSDPSGIEDHKIEL